MKKRAKTRARAAGGGDRRRRRAGKVRLDGLLGTWSLGCREGAAGVHPDVKAFADDLASFGLLCQAKGVPLSRVDRLLTGFLRAAVRGEMRSDGTVVISGKPVAGGVASSTVTGGEVGQQGTQANTEAQGT
jgi:hypothetical protein